MSELELAVAHAQIAHRLLQAHDYQQQACQLAFKCIARIIETAPHGQNCAAVVDGGDEAECDCYRADVRRLCFATA